MRIDRLGLAGLLLCAGCTSLEVVGPGAVEEPGQLLTKLKNALLEAHSEVVFLPDAERITVNQRYFSNVYQAERRVFRKPSGAITGRGLVYSTERIFMDDVEAVLVESSGWLIKGHYPVVRFKSGRGGKYRDVDDRRVKRLLKPAEFELAEARAWASRFATVVAAHSSATSPDSSAE